MSEQEHLETISSEKAEEILEEFEAPTRRFTGAMWYAATGLAVFCSLFALYGAFGSLITQVARFVHVMLILMLTFLYYPAARSWKNRSIVPDILIALLVFVVFAYPFMILKRSSTALRTLSLSMFSSVCSRVCLSWRRPAAPQALRFPCSS